MLVVVVVLDDELDELVVVVVLDDELDELLEPLVSIARRVPLVALPSSMVVSNCRASFELMPLEQR